MIYITLFFSALLSATLFPLGSEALFIYNISQNHSIVLLLFFATIGNTLGSSINYFLGFKGEEFLETRGYLSEKKVQKYKSYFDRYGGYSLLFSWLPIVGDPLTLIAGVFKYNFIKFFFIVLFAKFSRYFALYLIVVYFK